MRPPSSDDALAEARDLAFVCRHRAMPVHEIFPPNAYYGNDRVLKIYAGLPPDRPLKVVVPHGIVYNEAYVWEAERRAPLPAVLAYSESRAHAYQRATSKLPIRSAVPFAYLAALFGAVSPAERAGTLFFPSHSSNRATAEADFEGMADVLGGLDGKYQPVTVCIYWRDYELNRHRPFLDRGLTVASAGHIFDSDFLFRLYHLCRSHRYAAGNHAGSSLPYSVLAGCRYFMLPGFDMTYSGANDHLAEDLSGGGPHLDAIMAAFGAPVENTTSQQLELVREICGLGHLLSPEEMRAVLAMADRLDRFGVARHPGRRGVFVAMPRTQLRAGRRLARAARQLVAKLWETQS